MAFEQERENAPSDMRGFTLVELMIVVAIIGILAALGIYGVSKYLASAKSAEAKNSVGAIARAAVAEYTREHAESQVLTVGSSSVKISHVLCASALPVPNDIEKVTGKKYMPGNNPTLDFGTGDMAAGWTCLGFGINSPIYYRYQYRAGSGYVTEGLPGAEVISNDGFEASAQGDLDADGNLSTFARVGKVESGEINLATQLYTHDDTE